MEILGQTYGANNADPDQTAPTGAVWSESALFAIHSKQFCLTSDT